MPHEFAGNFAAKHPPGTESDPVLAEAIEQKIKEGTLSCAAAHGIAQSANVPVAEVGKTVDLLNYRIVKCQMGLFGYSPGKKIVERAASVSPKLRDAIHDALVHNRLPCTDAWRIAEEFHISLLGLGAACENLRVKIKPCQLGAF